MTYRGVVANLFMRLCSLLPIQDKVVFSCFDGKTIGDNPEVIYQEMKKQRPDLTYVWFSKNQKTHLEQVILVKPFSFRGLYELSTAKLWIDNSRKKKWTYKRKNQYYVQTWHGDVSLKKMEKDAEEFLGETYITNAKYDSKIADLFISGSTYRTNNYRSAFWYDGEILELGTPKSVVFYEDAAPSRKKVEKYFNISPETKIALYCPTFRSNNSLESYNIDYEKMYRSLCQRWPGEWKIFVRLHPNIQELQYKITYTDDIINASNYSSTNELVLSSELIITDYSGCMFAGLESNRKVILYASDVDNYVEQERGMYFNLEELPFPLAKSNQELQNIICNFNEEDYKLESEEFKKIIGYKTNVESTKKIVKYILERVWAE